jgi:3-oxoacyl-[acyl-carrier protein] reductase
VSKGGRTVIITGGAGDLARGIACCFEGQGYTVLAPGRDALDVADPDQVTSWFKRVPLCDVLINNAGNLADSPFVKMTEAGWSRVIDVSLSGAFRCSKAVLRPMRKAGGGHIINIGSYSALTGPAGQANYAAAKAGLIGLTLSLAKEMGSSNIRVNCVLPGFLETKFVSDVTPAAAAAILNEHQLARFNTVEDAARFVAFLDTMANVSGQVFQLDSRVSRWC